MAAHLGPQQRQTKPHRIRQDTRQYPAQSTIAERAFIAFFDVGARMIHQMHVMHAGGAGRHAGKAGQAAVICLTVPGRARSVAAGTTCLPERPHGPLEPLAWLAGALGALGAAPRCNCSVAATAAAMACTFSCDAIARGEPCYMLRKGAGGGDRPRAGPPLLTRPVTFVRPNSCRGQQELEPKWLWAARPARPPEQHTHTHTTHTHTHTHAFVGLRLRIRSAAYAASVSAGRAGRRERRAGPQRSELLGPQRRLSPGPDSGRGPGTPCTSRGSQRRLRPGAERARTATWLRRCARALGRNRIATLT